jgi:hypothetical protein
MTRPQVGKGAGQERIESSKTRDRIPVHNRLTVHRRSGLKTSLLAVKASTTDCLREKNA